MPLEVIATFPGAFWRRDGTDASGEIQPKRNPSVPLRFRNSAELRPNPAFWSGQYYDAIDVRFNQTFNLGQFSGNRRWDATRKRC